MKLKKLAFLMLAATFTTTAVACSDGAKQDQIVEKNKLDKAIDDSGEIVEKRLLSVGVDTSAVQKVFYIGDIFNHEGLIVRANFVNYVGDVRQEGTIVEYPDNFTVDSSEVDMNTLGTYPVLVTYRYGSMVRNITYNVEVKSSKLETTPGIKYVAGLKVRWKGTNTNVKTTVIGVSDYDFSSADLEYKKIEREIGSDLTITETESSIRSSNLTFDSSTYDKTKEGVYIIKISYNNENLIDGEDYKIVSFVIIEVGNPVTDLSFKSGSTTFSASPNEFDFSDWKFNVTYADGSVVETPYSADDFEITGYNPAKVSSDQYASIKFIGKRNKNDGFATVKVKLEITASTDYDITIFDSLPDFNDPGTTTPVVYKFNNSDDLVFYAGKGSKSEKDKIRGIDGGINFQNRPTLSTKANGSYVELKMDSAGYAIFYMCSTGTDGDRKVELYDAEGVVVGSADVKDKGESDVPVAYKMKIDKAGTYKLYATQKSVYFYGAIVAEEKVA